MKETKTCDEQSIFEDLTRVRCAVVATPRYFSRFFGSKRDFRFRGVSDEIKIFFTENDASFVLSKLLPTKDDESDIIYDLLVSGGVCKKFCVKSFFSDI